MFDWVRERLGRKVAPSTEERDCAPGAASPGAPAAATPSVGTENLFPFEREDFVRDPYPHYRRLREEAPLYSSPEGYWVLSRHDDVLEALAHPLLGNRPSRYSTLHGSKAGRLVCANVAANILPFLDGPEHRRQRGTLASLFQRRVRTWSVELPDRVEVALSSLASEFEVMGDFATPLARGATRSLLGFPDENRLARWSDHFFYLFTKIPSAELREEIDRSLAEYRVWAGELLRQGEGRGLVQDFRGAIESGALTEEVAIDTLLLLYADGVQNVDTGMANALHALAGTPQEWGRLTEEGRPALVMEECLRYDSPAQFVARTVLEDFDWRGQHLKRDHTVFLLLASANRDGARFERPDEFCPDRPRGLHLSFGKGRHACLGGNLFELELRTVLEAMGRRYTTLELVSPVRWQRRAGHRWIESASFRVT